MKKWYNEEYEFEIEVTGFLRGDHTEHYCRNLLCKKKEHATRHAPSALLPTAA